MEQSDPAPALGRGIALVRLLDREGPLSLERLTTLSGWPKTSLLRLLTSLCLHKIAVREPSTRRYRLREALRPATDAGGRLRQTWEELVAGLPDGYPHTLELHAWDGRTLTMVDRRDPEVGDLQVQARIGWRRSFDEFDALTQIVLAWGRIPPPTDLWCYGPGGREPVAAQRRQAVIADTATTGQATDPAPNTHGVVRSAVGIRDGDRLLGIIAAAQVASPGRPPDPVPPLPNHT